MLANFVVSILELNWNQRCTDKKTNLKICIQVLTSSTQRQNWSFHVAERARATVKCKKKFNNARVKPAKVLLSIHLLNMQICEVLVTVVVVLA